jgi:hypothetical protein
VTRMTGGVGGERGGVIDTARVLRVPGAVLGHTVAAPGAARLEHRRVSGHRDLAEQRDHGNEPTTGGGTYHGRSVALCRHRGLPARSPPAIRGEHLAGDEIGVTEALGVVEQRNNRGRQPEYADLVSDVLGHERSSSNLCVPDGTLPRARHAFHKDKHT